MSPQQPSARESRSPDRASRSDNVHRRPSENFSERCHRARGRGSMWRIRKFGGPSFRRRARVGAHQRKLQRTIGAAGPRVGLSRSLCYAVDVHPIPRDWYLFAAARGESGPFIWTKTANDILQKVTRANLPKLMPLI